MSEAKATRPARKTLVQQQSEMTVKDPSEHAKRQVGELDKTAKKSLAKRKACNDQLEADAKEIEKINIQLERIHLRYDPLVESLRDKMERKAHLLKMLEQCLGEEKRMMNDMKVTVTTRKQDDSKLNKAMASYKLSTERGFDILPDSTFKQKSRK